MFQFPGLSPRPYLVQGGVLRHDPEWVPPFGDLRIKGCVPLPAAYRSLPRPSSTSCAKASAVRPWYLHLPSKVRTEKRTRFSRYFELVFKHTFAIVLSVHDANHHLSMHVHWGLWFRIMVRGTSVPRAMQLSRSAGRSPGSRMLRTRPGDDLREIGFEGLPGAGSPCSTRLGLCRVSLERR